MKNDLKQIVQKKEVEMRVSDLVKKYKLKVYAGESGMGNTIEGAYVSDLLSDVMGNALENEVWITLQTHQNVAAIASLKDLAAVILVKDLEPEPETIAYCEKEEIPLLGTDMQTFEISGRLFSDLNTATK